jgi:uncharacterized protein
VSLITGDGRVSLTAGLFLTGSALVRYGVIDRLPGATSGERSTGRTLPVVAIVLGRVDQVDRVVIG